MAHRRQSRSAARSMANDDEAHARSFGAAAAGKFESTASLSSSGRNNPSAFSGVSPNANSTSFRAIQLRQMDLLMTAIQKVSDAVDSNTSAIRDMQRQNQHMQEFTPSQQLRTSPTNEHNINCSEPQQQQQAFDIFIPTPSDQRSPSSSDGCSSSSSSSGVNPDEGLDRKQTRLDGLKVYAVVSAGTAGTLVAVFDSYHPGDILDLFASGRWLELCLSLLFSLAGAFGIVCGLHCVFVFSLISTSMYGRTALGMERDDALEIFFSGTGLQRYHGFKAFVASLYSLGTCLLVVIASKISSNPTIHLLALMVSAKLMHYVYRDTQDIMSKATVIFAPPAAPSPPISSSHKMEESTVMEVEVEEALDMEDVENFAEEESNAQQQMIASTNDHLSLPRNDKKLGDDSEDKLPQDDATKSQSATTDASSKKDKQQNRSRRRRSSLGLSAVEHIAMEEQKCTTTKKRASAMTLSATDLMGANVGVSRSSSMASPDQKTKRGKAATTRSADTIEIQITTIRVMSKNLPAMRHERLSLLVRQRIMRKEPIKIETKQTEAMTTILIQMTTVITRPTLGDLLIDARRLATKSMARSCQSSLPSHSQSSSPCSWPAPRQETFLSYESVSYRSHQNGCSCCPTCKHNEFVWRSAGRRASNSSRAPSA